MHQFWKVNHQEYRVIGSQVHWSLLLNTTTLKNIHKIHKKTKIWKRWTSWSHSFNWDLGSFLWISSCKILNLATWKGISQHHTININNLQMPLGTRSLKIHATLKCPISYNPHWVHQLSTLTVNRAINKEIYAHERIVDILISSRSMMSKACVVAVTMIAIVNK